MISLGTSHYVYYHCVVLIAKRYRQMLLKKSINVAQLNE